MTGLAAAIVKGQKLPMFGIGKSKKWVRELDDKFEKKNRKVPIVIDNCTAHPDIGGLKAIDLFFFFLLTLPPLFSQWMKELFTL